MSRKPPAPKGYVLTKHEGYYINDRGFRTDGNNEPPNRPLMADGAIGVAWFNEDEPFVAATSADGEHEGYSPNVQVLPITDGWVPPVYTLHTKEEAP